MFLVVLFKKSEKTKTNIQVIGISSKLFSVSISIPLDFHWNNVWTSPFKHLLLGQCATMPFSWKQTQSQAWLECPPKRGDGKIPEGSQGTNYMYIYYIYSTYINIYIYVFDVHMRLQIFWGFKIGMSQPSPEPEPEPLDSNSEALVEEFSTLSLVQRSDSLSVAASSTENPESSVTILENPRFAEERVLQELDRDFSRRFALRTAQPVDLRFYVVWRIPECAAPTQFSGLHLGVGSRAYSRILALNNNTFTGLPFRRVDCLVDGREHYLREADRQQAPVEFAARVFYWQ